MKFEYIKNTSIKSQAAEKQFTEKHNVQKAFNRSNKMYTSVNPEKKEAVSKVPFYSILRDA